MTITGGKATTLRAMADTTANVVCAKVGMGKPWQTRGFVLLPHTAYYVCPPTADRGPPPESR